MKPDPKLPEIERGTEVFAVDPLTVRAHFEVDYVHSFKQDTPFFHGLQKRQLPRQSLRQMRLSLRDATFALHVLRRQNRVVRIAGRRPRSFVDGLLFRRAGVLKDVPFTLVLVEFAGVDTLFLSRLIGVERADIRIGMKVKPKFRRKATWSVRDVYFIPAS